MVFLNESLQTAFPNNVLLARFTMNVAKVNSPSESCPEERGGVRRALSHLKENDTIQFKIICIALFMIQSLQSSFTGN